MNLQHELHIAIENKNRALSDFNNADVAFIDVAIYQYNAALEKVNVILQMIKDNSDIKERVI